MGIEYNKLKDGAVWLGLGKIWTTFSNEHITHFMVDTFRLHITDYIRYNRLHGKAKNTYKKAASLS